MTYEEALENFIIRDGDLWWSGGHGSRPLDKPVGCIDAHGYRVFTYKGKKQYAHRIVFLLTYGHLPSEIDHINGDRADNRPENLREVTSSQNKRNMGFRSDNTTGVKGACWHSGRNKWEGRVWINGKKKSLGYFETLEECARAREEAEKKYYGEHRRKCSF